jgi:hypothetical protein
MLKLMCQTIGHLVEAAWRTISRCGGSIGKLLLICGRVAVVKISLAVDATARRLCAPDLLLPCGVGKWLRKGGRGCGKGSALLGGEVGRIGEAKVKVKAVLGRVRVCWQLLLLRLLLL